MKYSNSLEEAAAFFQDTMNWNMQRIEQLNRDFAQIQNAEMARIAKEQIEQTLCELESRRDKSLHYMKAAEVSFSRMPRKSQDNLANHMAALKSSKEALTGFFEDQIGQMKESLSKIAQLHWSETSFTKAGPAPSGQHDGANERILNGSLIRPERSLQDVTDEITQLVGLEAVKSEITTLINFLKVQEMRRSAGLPTTEVSLHQVFVGNPGTGKTTVARLLSEAFRAMKLLSKGHLIETDRSGLVAGYVGQTALKTREIVEKAIGGILFIDEAYALVASGQDFGQEAIDTLMKLMEDHREELVVVVAGYAERMERFLEANQGLRSRFSRYLIFDDYTPEQLMMILKQFCANGRYQIDVDAESQLAQTIARAYSDRKESFGNARWVRNLFERMIEKQADRLSTLAKVETSELTRITVEDLPM